LDLFKNVLNLVSNEVLGSDGMVWMWDEAFKQMICQQDAARTSFISLNEVEAKDHE